MNFQYKESYLFWIFLWIRLLMAIISTSYHHPDETYQSVEIAHHLVFGKGYLTWEWTTNNPIRSYLHPLIFAALFYVLKISRLDSIECIILLPRMLQGLISAVGDLYSLKFYRLYFGVEGQKWFLLAYMTNSSLLYFMSRTLINSLETALGSIAMFFYALSIRKSCQLKKDLRTNQSTKRSSKDIDIAKDFKTQHALSNSIRTERIYVTLITLSFIMRATTAILWLPLVSYHVFLLSKTNQFISVLLKKLVPLSLALIISTIVIDSIYHGKLVFVHWNFFRLNLLVDFSSQCGKQPIYGYILIGMWKVNFVGLFLFPGIFKLWKSVPNFRVYIVAGVTTFFILSSIGHKEVRFWLPCVPLCLCVSAYYMQTSNFVLNKAKMIYFLTILCNFAVLYHQLFFIQFGATNVTNFLHQDIKQLKATPSNEENDTKMNILYMTKCYSTPLYSHIHSDIKIDIAPCPLIIKEEWKSSIDQKRQNVWLNDDTDLLSEWPHLYVFKHFRHPINESEFKLDKFNQKYASGYNNFWDTFYKPDINAKQVNCNLTKKMIESHKYVKVYGNDKPMPSHIVTLASRGYEVYNHFLEKKGYEIVKKLLHSKKLFFEKTPEMYFNVYRKKSLTNQRNPSPELKNTSRTIMRSRNEQYYFTNIMIL